MGQIRVLPTSLISRIAAGECIERPASVVKELVENALDAGTSRVDVVILDGGRERIQVADDGVGMDAGDLPLSVTQHATSKIREDDDLFNIQTMGFRGEALASIAAVSRVRITSRRRDQEVGHELRADAGELSGPRPCAAPVGTTVEVRDLFYAVPARRKFLRTNQTEMGHVSEQLARIALAHPEVAFSLKHQNRVTHQLATTQDRRQRIADFYGPELAEVLLPIRREGRGVAIDGLVAPPAESRGSGKWEYVFVNGRYVRDRFVSHAVKEAYRSLIDPSRYPIAFLYITVDPAAVDVNVHPTKVEVRWRDSNYVHGQVLAALRDKFLASKLDHRLRTPSDGEDYREHVRQAMVDFFTRAQPTQHTAGFANQDAPTAPTAEPPTARRLTADDAGGETAAWSETPAPEQQHAGMPREASPAPQRAIQVHNAYLVVETDEGVMIVDQHALHERILYEELRRRMTAGRLEAQRLLIPEVVQVPPDRLEALETHVEMLAQLGIELSAAGPQAVALQAFPTLLLERVHHGRFVRDLLDFLADKGRRMSAETAIHEVLDMMACKAAVKAGDPLTGEEIQALLARRDTAERSSHCPHGRPTTLQLTLRDLERQFHRR
jgi:DNA mismatch repair protein MutL